MKMKILSVLFGGRKKWEPVRHTVFNNKNHADIIHNDGYMVIDMFNDQQIDALNNLYKNTHDIHAQDGGMFYGMYSQNLGYREKIHKKIKEIIKPSLDSHFKDYSNVINFFITKLPGPNSQLNIHQDMTSLDENRFSPLSIWIPLQDVTEENGAICLVPKSHRMFSPYRSISFETPFSNIAETIVPYLKPIPLVAGQALIFDPRVLHHSLPNWSEKPRVSVVAGIFPQGAEIITCFKDPGPNNEIEMLLQPNDFLLTNLNFFHNCTDRPKTGITIKKVGLPMRPLTPDQFIKKCKELDIHPNNKPITFLNKPCSMIGEPLNP